MNEKTPPAARVRTIEALRLGPLRQLTEALLVLTIAQVLVARVKSRSDSSLLETATGEAIARDARREVMMMNFISRIEDV